NGRGRAGRPLGTHFTARAVLSWSSGAARRSGRRRAGAATIALCGPVPSRSPPAATWRADWPAPPPRGRTRYRQRARRRRLTQAVAWLLSSVMARRCSSHREIDEGFHLQSRVLSRRSGCGNRPFWMRVFSCERDRLKRSQISSWVMVGLSSSGRIVGGTRGASPFIADLTTLCFLMVLSSRSTDCGCLYCWLPAKRCRKEDVHPDGNG